MSYNLPVSYQYSQDPALRSAYWGGRITEERASEAAKIARENAEMQAKATLASGAMVSSAVRAANIASMEAMRENTTMLNNTMVRGFGEMSANMSMGFARMEDSIMASSLAICEKLDAINRTLENPRYTQARELYREAEKNFGKGFYEEARDDLLKAVELNKADYFSWFLLGKTYLFGAGEFSTVADLDKAGDALTTATKYITPDARAHGEAKPVAAEIIFNLALAKLYKSNVLYLENSDEAPRFLDEAQKAFDQSWGYSDKMLEAQWLGAWCKTQKGDKVGALADLEAVILADERYAIKTAQDIGFESISEEYKTLIERLRKDILPQVQAKFSTYDRHRERLLSLGKRFPDGVSTLENFVQVYRDANPAQEKAGYVDMRRILPVLEQCMALLGPAVSQAEKERAEEQRLYEENRRLAKDRATGLIKSGDEHVTKASDSGDEEKELSAAIKDYKAALDSWPTDDAEFASFSAEVQKKIQKAEKNTSGAKKRNVIWGIIVIAASVALFAVAQYAAKNSSLSAVDAKVLRRVAVIVFGVLSCGSFGIAVGAKSALGRFGKILVYLIVGGIAGLIICVPVGWLLSFIVTRVIVAGFFLVFGIAFAAIGSSK